MTFSNIFHTDFSFQSPFFDFLKKTSVFGKQIQNSRIMSRSFKIHPHQNLCLHQKNFFLFSINVIFSYISSVYFNNFNIIYSKNLNFKIYYKFLEFSDVIDNFPSFYTDLDFFFLLLLLLLLIKQETKYGIINFLSHINFMHILQAFSSVLYF